ncbi:hypothetical protein SNEBB_008117 [Seison nebaliae]|nr:hypothetical protein SNEBB_008117 [Seison nebaliae]
MENDYEIDDALKVTTRSRNGCGWYQFRAYLLLCFIFGMTTGFDLTSQIYLMFTPEHKCIDDRLIFTNLTHEFMCDYELNGTTYRCSKWKYKETYRSLVQEIANENTPME